MSHFPSFQVPRGCKCFLQPPSPDCKSFGSVALFPIFGPYEPKSYLDNLMRRKGTFVRLSHVISIHYRDRRRARPKDEVGPRVPYDSAQSVISITVWPLLRKQLKSNLPSWNIIVYQLQSKASLTKKDAGKECADVFDVLPVAHRLDPVVCRLQNVVQTLKKLLGRILGCLQISTYPSQILRHSSGQHMSGMILHFLPEEGQI